MTSKMTPPPLIIIQARMGSSRLPGKVMLPLNGIPSIELMVKRLQRHEHLRRIVIATSTEPENDTLCDHMAGLSVAVFRGSEDDVLARFAECFEKHKAEVVIRLTADCPFIDPEIIIQLLDTYHAHGVDYANLSPKFAEGLDAEVMSASSLLTAHKNAQKPSEREHVTSYIRNNPSLFNIIEHGQAIDQSHYRFTIDAAADFQVATAIADHFGERCLTITAQDIINYLTTHPDVFSLNSHIIRNEGMLSSLTRDGTENWKNHDTDN